MLATPYRLPARTRFSRARVYKTPLFLLRFQPNNLSTSRFGFVVSKKVSTKAVTRNRQKRVFRSLVEESLPTIQPGYDFLFVLSPIITEKSREEMEEMLQETLSKNKLLNH